MVSSYRDYIRKFPSTEFDQRTDRHTANNGFAGGLAFLQHAKETYVWSLLVKPQITIQKQGEFELEIKAEYIED